MNDKSKELFKFDEKELQNCLDLNEILQNELDKI
jgi:hypothetical protein